MRAFATDVVIAWSACLFVYWVYQRAVRITARLTDVPFEGDRGADSCGPRELYVLDRGVHWHHMAIGEYD